MAKQTAEVITPADLDGLPDGSTYKRMSATEQGKLTGVEDNATSDQSGAEIKTAYEAEANAYTDTKDTKLAGVDDGAEVNPTGAEIQTAVEGLSDSARTIMVSDPQSGEMKIHGLHRNAAGNMEYDYDDVPV